MGPAGPAAPLPAPPPTPYVGTFYLLIDNNPPIFLTQFAGCFDKIIGVEYEDCYFSIRVLSEDVIAWLGEMLNGRVIRHSLRVIQSDFQGTAIAELAIEKAFMRDLSVSDFDAADSSPGSISFVVIPGSIAKRPGGSSINGTTGSTFRSQNFRASIDGVDPSRVYAVRGLHVAWAKEYMDLSGTRRLFEPAGPPVFDDILLDVGTGGSTVANLEAWVNQVAGATVPPLRNGDVVLLAPDLTTAIGDVRLFDLVPTGALSVFPTASGRTIVLDVGRFTLEVR